jgi:putative PIG3 family NAD(P)H quinone oxidoreductase
MIDLLAMKAVAIEKPGGPEVLVLVERPSPEPSRGEVRVRVRATAVNRADLLQRMGAYPAPPDAPPDIPGLEFAGEVDALGQGVTRLAIGDRVCGLVGGGAYAEAIVAHERALVKLPPGMSFEEAAAIPEAFVTAHDALVSQAELHTGETCLVHAVGSGVGTAAVQLAHACGARVVGTARTQDKLERARQLGMDDGFLVEGARFADRVGSCAVVLELVGGAYLAEDLRCIDTLGRIVLVGVMAGAKAELDLGLVLRKRARIFGTMLRARPLEEKLAAMRAFDAQVMPLFARGACKPVIDRVMPLAEAAAAHVHMASNAGFGKIVLRV